MTIQQELITIRGKARVYSFTLMNRQGMTVSLINYGGIITGIRVPDRNGRIDNIVLHYDHAADYFNDVYYTGAVAGRYANRISGGRFSIGKDAYRLTVNETALNNHLHGGFSGFNKKVWHVLPGHDAADRVAFSCHSPHLEEGYPGNLDVQVAYALTDDNALQVTYTARTDRPTIVNLTNHSYFNLSGKDQSIADHELSINASAYTPADDRFIPTGDRMPVAGTLYDLRQMTKAGRVAASIPTINYCLDGGQKEDAAAQLYDPAGGRRLRIYTTEPGLQLYFGNFLQDPFRPFSGLCLEPQHYPDSPNHPEFPTVILMPEEIYSQKTTYKFDAI